MRRDNGIAERNRAFDQEDFIDRLMGDEVLGRKIIRVFIHDMPGQLALLAQAVANRHGAAVRLAAHSINGAAGSAGGVEMQQIAAQLEQSGNACDLAAAAAILPELEASFERAKLVMERFCNGHPRN